MGLLSLAACGDKNLEEYQRSELERTLSQLRQVQGRYTGLVYSNIDKSLMGAMALDIHVETRSQGTSNSASERAQGRPVLISVVKFVDASNTLTINSQDGYFDVTSNQLQVNIPVSHSGSQVTEDLSLGARMNDDRLDGDIGVTGYTEFGGGFDLVRDGQEPEVLLKNQGPQEKPSNGLIFSHKYKGETTFNDGRIAPIELYIAQQSLSPQEDFYNKFVPIKAVQFSINFGQGFAIVHGASRWDVREGGLLTGDYAVPSNGPSGDTRRLSTECRRKGQGAETEWACQHISSTIGVAATTVAVDPASSRQFSNDSFTGTNNGISVSFSGTASYIDEIDQKKKKTDATLAVTLPADTRGTQVLEAFFPVREKSLALSLQLFRGRGGGTPVVISFNTLSTVWDRESGNLTGITSLMHGAERFDFQILCTGFYLDRTSKDFQCKYNASNRLYPFDITFSPPKRQ